MVGLRQVGGKNRGLPWRRVWVVGLRQVGGKNRGLPWRRVWVVGLRGMPEGR
ncbi:hypothetical protein NPX99_05360 [Bartonella sp. 220]|uniref:hypothetical protein n=1 Tax=Bartonella sp. 220B TaxID=2967260 RepID=UPI0022A8F6D2|nr:hypothetical protein [Bartonella sp. 220B]MCZ2158700.1 hypothetical protein [Bartonella sp. 220B]